MTPDGFNFADQRKAWSNPPVDDVGYLSSSELLRLPDTELLTVIERMRLTRYGGWRNHGNLWRDVLGLDSTFGRYVLDLGCGIGLEALEYVSSGNEVELADITLPNMQLARRVVQLHHPTASLNMCVVADTYPFWRRSTDRGYDVIHCVGVLHHIPWARAVAARCAELLTPRGELRLMLYSDRGWRLATGTEPPDEVVGHPKFDQFVTFFDSVGSYADWYDRGRLEVRFGDLFTIERFAYITPDERYLAAVLRVRS